MFSKNHYINLASGRFDNTQLSDLDAAFESFDASKPSSGLVIHFHGGLVNEKAAMTSAEALFKTFSETGAYPFFFVWETGLWETFRNNLTEIAQETLFKKIVSYLVDHLLKKLGVDSSSFALESVAVGKSPQEQVEEWIDQQKAPTSPVPQQAPFDEIRNEEARAGLTGNEADEQELAAAMRGDAELQKEIDELNRQLFAPPSSAEANESGLGYKTPGHLTASALQELSGIAERPERTPHVPPPVSAEESLIGIGITVGRVAVAAARIGYRVIRRYSKGRDHGLYTTVVEEVLRDLYVGKLGAELFWNQMKRDTLDAFGDDDRLYGGTAFLRRLVKRFENVANPPRVTLVGHSAGAIYLCNFLIHAHREFKQLPDVKFDVVMLAPAVDFDLFNQAIQTQRIGNVRSFGMRDQLEAKDALLAPFSSTLKYVYPKSLLYLVSGLLETEVDRPLVGMERYYPGKQYEGRLFQSVAAVKKFFAAGPDRLIWSVAKSGPGLSSESARHMDFNQTDPVTLASVLHILKAGFVQAVDPDSGLESMQIERVSDADLSRMLDGMDDSEAIQILNDFSSWLDSNTTRKLHRTGVGLALPIAREIISAPAAEMSDGELAKLTLKVAAQDEKCQQPLAQMAKSSRGVKGTVSLAPDAVLVGLQSQIHIDESDGKINVQVLRPSYELSRAAAEMAARADESTRYSPRTSELLINEDKVAAALASLHSEDLAAVFAKVQHVTPPELSDATKEKFAWDLVNDKLNRGESLEDLLITANLVVPSAGLLQRFLAKDKKVSRSLRRQISVAQQRAYDPTGTPEVVSPMTLRLRSPEVDLKNIPGLTIVSKVGNIVAAEGTAASLSALEDHEDVLTVDNPHGLLLPECRYSMAHVGATNAKARTNEGGDQCLVAIIDGGIDVMHHAFRQVADPMKTRLVGIWDLSDPTGKQNHTAGLNTPGTLLPPAGFEAAGGTWHSKAAIENYLASGVLGGNLQRDRGGHGSHVASIAAGSATPANLPSFPGGVAHEAPILAIIVGSSEYEEGSPNQIGYSNTLVSALEFAQAKAEELKLPVSVNMSQGHQSGGHDGTTTLEAAIDSFCQNGRARGRAVVKSAGNSRATAGHAYATIAPKFLENLEWVSDVQKTVNFRTGRVKDVIEVWFNPSEQMGFLLFNPNSDRSISVNFTNPHAAGVFPNGNTYIIDYDKHFRDNGHGRLRIEIAAGTAKAILDGKWQLEMVNGDTARAQELHAWIEVTDWQPAQFTGFAQADTTLTIPGTANSVITVAAVQIAPQGVAKFSCFGKTRHGLEKPEISAPGVNIMAAEGNTLNGFIERDGTSMAAPHVTGAVALVFSAAKKQGIQIPSANEVRQAFRNINNNHWDRGSGYGVLNVDALLQFFGL
ncbi:S8 family serine peptidase [Anatilimnocola floriformis]|uniref:S8 family serine peptidase n=1 Tax=Anatilimnocola floriformis TaxID=2948575 RepID=UPI0028F42FEC|nr:S8 family serine peptidase [Anatilimnocola floriformis]